MLKKSKKIPKTRPSRKKKNRHSTSKRRANGKKYTYKVPFSTSRIIFRTFFLILIGVILFSIYIIATLPSITEGKALYRSPLIIIMSEDHKEIARFGNNLAHPVTFEKLPENLIKLLLQTEDKRFFYHFGVDPIAVSRAFLINLTRYKKAYGGSTITQQLAKNLFLSPQKTYMRKIRELYLSFWLELRFSKKQILTLYLNRTYFGSGIYGIGNAAEYYYGKKIEDLTDYEAASLITTLKAPARYNPMADPEKSKQRTKLILRNAGIKAFKETTPLHRSKNGERHFADWVVEQATAYIGEIKEDIIIHTTLDTAIQYAAIQAAKLSGKYENAIIITDYNGAVKAMVGGRDYRTSQFNRATLAYRQTGSAIKPFIYLLAMKKGYPLDMVIDDTPFSIKGWTPLNFSKQYHGKISLRESLVLSLNTIPVRLTEKIGVNIVQDFTGKFGINTKCVDSPVIALGACTNTLIDIIGAYGSLASGGYGTYPYGITGITSKDGNILYHRMARDKKILISPSYLREMDDTLEEAVARGTGKNAYIAGAHIKGKTGTSQDYRDAYFIGYGLGYVGAVWVGNDNNSPMQGVTGGSLPAKIFRFVFSSLPK